MPLLTIPLVPVGAFLDVGVGATTAYTTAATRPDTWGGLIDTGAVMTAVSPAVVAALQPQRISSVPLGRVGSPGFMHDTYLVRIRFGGHNGPGRWYTVEAVEAQPVTPDVDVLIGMDLLYRLDMSWESTRRRVLLSH
jgi:hypothetical protein